MVQQQVYTGGVIMEFCKIVKNGTYVKEYGCLLNYCFGMKQEHIQAELDGLFLKDDSDFFGAIDEGLLQAGLIINDYSIYWNGIDMKMGGIGGVASFPEAREKHCVADLLKKSIESMYNKGQLFSLLAPFAYGFYRKYGWEWAITKKNIEINLNDLAHFRGEGLKVKPINQDDVDSIKKVYEEHYSIYNGASKRTDLQWNYKLSKFDKDSIRSYGVFDNDDNMCGYVFYKIENGKFNIHEMCYTTLAARKQLLGFVRVHRAQVEHVNMTVPEDDNTLLLLKNQYKKISLDSSMMVRVIDVKKVLELCPYDVDSIEFSIKVTDEYADWNNKLFTVHKDADKITVSEDATKEPDITCSIQAFSQVLFGFTSFKELASLELIEFKDSDNLSKISDAIPKKKTFVTDAF